MKVLERPQARYDLQEIVSYIAEDSIESAWEFFRAYDRTIKILKANPKAGAPGSLACRKLSGIRLIVVSGMPRYNIYYILHSDHIEIIRVLHSARDVNKNL